MEKYIDYLCDPLDHADLKLCHLNSKSDDYYLKNSRNEICQS